MKDVLVTECNRVVFEGKRTEAENILRILNADAYGVSEEDEVNFGLSFHKLLNSKGQSRFGKLKHETHFNLKFRGIDDWNRPVFKDVDSKLYFGDVNKLWVYIELGENNENIIKYYKENQHQLEFFGTKFNCEPHGGRPKHYKFNIIG